VLTDWGYTVVHWGWFKVRTIAGGLDVPTHMLGVKMMQ
jgi:hypothetical protein